MMNRPPKVSNYLKENIVFFCKDCEELVEVKPVGRKFVYRCAKCGTKNVAFGTEKSIKSFYRMNEDEEVEGTPEEQKKDQEEKVPEQKPEQKAA